jgi:hypothetical protein
MDVAVEHGMCMMHGTAVGRSRAASARPNAVAINDTSCVSEFGCSVFVTQHRRICEISVLLHMDVGYLPKDAALLRD